jgi:shikimate O-hydroxycinnamoyltransferase
MTVQITQHEVMRPLARGGGGRKEPLTAFDRASTDGYRPMARSWTASSPLLRGTRTWRRCFHLNDAGVLIAEADADADLAEALARDVNELYPKAHKVNYYYSIRSIKLKQEALLRKL